MTLRSRTVAIGLHSVVSLWTLFVLLPVFVMVISAFKSQAELFTRPLALPKQFSFAAFERDKPKLAAQVQPIFISIDPARDTPAVVGEFAGHFSPRLLGLTGTAAQVDQAAKAFSAYYAKGKQTGGGYLMDHSRVAYLMGRKGEPISMLPVDKGPQAVAAELAKWVN